MSLCKKPVPVVRFSLKLKASLCHFRNTWLITPPPQQELLGNGSQHGHNKTCASPRSSPERYVASTSTDCHTSLTDSPKIIIIIWHKIVFTSACCFVLSPVARTLLISELHQWLAERPANYQITRAHRHLFDRHSSSACCIIDVIKLWSCPIFAFCTSSALRSQRGHFVFHFCALRAQHRICLQNRCLRTHPSRTPSHDLRRVLAVSLFFSGVLKIPGLDTKDDSRCVKKCQ